MALPPLPSSNEVRRTDTNRDWFSGKVVEQVSQPEKRTRATRIQVLSTAARTTCFCSMNSPGGLRKQTGLAGLGTGQHWPPSSADRPDSPVVSDSAGDEVSVVESSDSGGGPQRATASVRRDTERRRVSSGLVRVMHTGRVTDGVVDMDFPPWNPVVRGPQQDGVVTRCYLEPRGARSTRAYAFESLHRGGLHAVACRAWRPRPPFSPLRTAPPR